MKFPKFSLNSELNELKKFEDLDQDKKQIVFYSENENSMLIFESLINELVNVHNYQICYVTSSQNEPILKESSKKIRTFCIGEGIARTKFFLNLKADILIMTMPDLGNFHIKRSKVYSVHYVYLFHAMVSTHLVYKKNAFDNYDSVFCVGQYQIDEIRNAEKKYNLKPKNLVHIGYSHLDNLIKKYEPQIKKNTDDSQTKILLAPSWGNNGLFETIIEDVIDILLENKYKIILRPHPMSLKFSQKKIKILEKKFSSNNNFILETNFLNFDSYFFSDIMISDWSGSALEFAFAFKKPILYIDVPKKIHNPDYQDIPEMPIEIWIRDKIGKIVLPSNINQIPIEIDNINKKASEFEEKIRKIRNEKIFNIGNSEKIAVSNIIKLLNKIKNN